MTTLIISFFVVSFSYGIRCRPIKFGSSNNSRTEAVILLNDELVVELLVVVVVLLKNNRDCNFGLFDLNLRYLFNPVLPITPPFVGSIKFFKIAVNVLNYIGRKRTTQRIRSETKKRARRHDPDKGRQN